MYKGEGNDGLESSSHDCGVAESRSMRLKVGGVGVVELGETRRQYQEEIKYGSPIGRVQKIKEGQYSDKLEMSSRMSDVGA